jgi:hypothetical protein
LWEALRLAIGHPGPQLTATCASGLVATAAARRRNLLTVGWVIVVLGALHLTDHAGVVLSAFGLLFWDCHLAVEAGPRRARMGVRMSSQVKHEDWALCQFHQVRSEVMRRPSTAPDIDPSRYRAGVEAIGFTKNLLEGGKTMTAPTDAVVHAEWSPSPRRPPTGLHATTSTDHHEAWCGARLRLILTRPFDAGLQNACPACINAFRLGYPEALLGQEKLKRGL